MGAHLPWSLRLRHRQGSRRQHLTCSKARSWLRVEALSGRVENSTQQFGSIQILPSTRNVRAFVEADRDYGLLELLTQINRS